MASLETLVDQEKEYLNIVVQKILAVKPSIVFAEKTVSRLAQEKLLNNNITVVLNVKSHLMERISRSTQAPILNSPDHVDKMPREKLLGTCNLFRIQHFIDDTDNNNVRTLMFFEGGKADLHGTICLRGADLSTLSRVKSIMKIALHVAYNLSLETAYLYDSFATYPPSINLRNVRLGIKHEQAVVINGVNEQYSNESRIGEIMPPIDSDSDDEFIDSQSICDNFDLSKKISVGIQELSHEISSSPFMSFPLRDISMV